MTLWLRNTPVVSLTLFFVMLAAAPARAQQTNLDNDSNGERPWAKGVSPERQRKALDLFRQGNGALKDTLFKAAAEQYLLALAQWDHPAIHYNLALADLQIAPPEETYTQIVAALKYGRAPLDSDKFDQATRYKALLEGQLANIEIACVTEGATVKLDGKTLFMSPGSFKGMVRAGEHTILASKDGYVTTEQSQVIQAGQTSTHTLKLFTTADLTEYRRRFNVAVPWVVVGVGAALVGTGLGLHLAARDAFRAYDQGITECVSPVTGGCTPTLQLSEARKNGDRLQSFAIAGYITGGVALAAGAFLVYFNRLQAFRTSSGFTATLLPLVGPWGGSASLAVTF